LATLLISSIAAAEDRHSQLRRNALALPDTKADQVRPAVEAAIRHETPQIPAELLISIMWGESRFVPTVRNGVVCGIMQVGPHDIKQPRSVCLIWDRDVDAAVAAGVVEMKMLLKDKRVNGSIYRALLYRACGNSAFDGTCRKGGWPGWVLERASKLKGSRVSKPVEAL